MAEMNRFYQQSGSRYQSQFVPEKLPVDLMAKALYSKQAKANEMGAAAAKLGELEFAALPGHDTQYVKDWKKKLEKFTQDALMEDKTSPDFMRRYHSLVNDINKDEGIKKAAQAVKTHQEHEEHIKKLKDDGKGAYAKALDAEYQYRLNNYIREGGEGFTGLNLADPTTQRGVDVFAESLEFFKPLKESGGESIKFLDPGIAYKEGWTGISDKKVQEQAQRQYELWEDTDAAKQSRAQELYDLGYVDTTYKQLPEAEKKKVDEYLDSKMKNTFLNVGRSVVHGKSTTNMDVAYRAGRKEALDADYTRPFINTERVKLDESVGKTREKQIQESRETINLLKTNLKDENLAPEDRALFEKELKFYEQQELAYTKEHDAAYRNIVNKQTSKNSEKVEKFEEQTQQQLESLLFVPEEFRDELQDIVNTPIYRKPKELSSELNKRILSLPANQQLAINNVLSTQNSKSKIHEEVYDEIQNEWNQEFYTPGAGKSIVAVETFTAPKGKGSLMNSAKQNFEGNPEGFVIKNEYGQNISGEVIKGGGVEFDPNVMTMTDVVNENNFGIKGRVKYEVPELNEDGEAIRNKDGSLKTKQITQVVTIVPQGANQQFNRESVAKEQLEQARYARQRGDVQGEAAAKQIALKYRNWELSNQLEDFKNSELTQQKFEKILVPLDDNRVGEATLNLNKRKDSQGRMEYEVDLGGEFGQFSSYDIDEVFNFVSTLTQ